MILSIDVGIKNLSYCLFKIENDKYIIKDWDVVNLVEKNKPNICQNINSKNKNCTKVASYSLNNILFLCGTHIKTSNYTCVCDEYYKFINKNKSIDYLKTNFKDLPESILDNQVNNYIKENYLIKIQKPTSANLSNLIEIGKSIKNKLPLILPLENITEVLIENQIGPLAIIMKTIKAMLTQFFIDNNISNIEFISSQNKLKPYNLGKLSYKDRKIKSILITKKIIIK